MTIGKAHGTTAISVVNGSGLNFAVPPDRCLDIAMIDYKGIPLSSLPRTDESDFLRSFFACFLTTCGQTYVGAPCVDQGISLGAHSRISNTPAYVGVSQEWKMIIT